MTKLNPAERLAALRLMESGLKAAISEATTQAEAYMSGVGADRMRTPWGPLSATTRKEAITWTDDEALIAWAEEHAPHVVYKTIPHAAKRGLSGRYFRIVGDQVVSLDTGEVVEFATVKPESTGLTFRPTDEAKETAAAELLGRLDALMPAALPETSEEQA